MGSIVRMHIHQSIAKQSLFGNSTDLRQFFSRRSWINLYSEAKWLFTLWDIKKILCRLPATIRESLRALITFTYNLPLYSHLIVLTFPSPVHPYNIYPDRPLISHFLHPAYLLHSLLQRLVFL